MEPMIPWLVQRATFFSRPEKKGIDAILRFDYMGSAEFEFGALGDSLKAIRAELDQYDYFDLSINDRPLIVFCKREDEERVKEAIRGLSERRWRLKEYCDVAGYLRTDKYMKCLNDHWWDIGNHFMFWKPSFVEGMSESNFLDDFKEKIKG